MISAMELAEREALLRRGPGAESWFYSEVRDSEGKLKYRSGRHNLTTDTAATYVNRRDWQSKAMGGGAAATAFSKGAATATTATTLTNSGATFPTSGQGLAGQMVAVGPNSAGTGSTVFGVIVSNTATALTVDQWWDASTMSASTPGTTPNATGNYQILPGQFPAMLLAVTSDAAAPTSADTVLTSEATTNGFARKVAVFAHTAAATTYTLTAVWNATGSLTVNKEAVFGAANPTGGGVMPFESAEPTPPALLSGDTLTNVVTVTIN